MSRVREVLLPYGERQVTARVPDSNLIGVFVPQPATQLLDPRTLIEEALARPVSTSPLREIAEDRKNAVILVSDVTRPVPTHLMLPPLLNELRMAGMSMTEVRIVIATGLHRGHSYDEKRAIVGCEVMDCCVVEDHSTENCVNCGTTPSGLPLEVNRTVMEADCRICTGNIDPHYFAGYSGGAKAIMPGVCSRDSIAATHRMMFLPGAEIANVEGNPVRSAIDEVGDVIGIDFILNVVVTEAKEVAFAVAGHHVHAHREGCRAADSIFKVEIPQAFDIVVAAAGGFPKDIDLYQAQKGLDNARLAVKEGGTIILVAECREGFGNETFASWMVDAPNADTILARLNKEFVMGGHKAAAVARTLERARVILVSSMDPSLVSRALLEPANDVDQALQIAMNRHGAGATVGVFPYAGSVVPHLAQ